MFWAFVIVIGFAVALLLMAGRNVARRYVLRQHREQLRAARALFHQRREWIEASFVTAATQTGKPRGLAWEDCDFDNDVAFARERNTGELRALVGVAIGFSAIEGGGMEDVEAVANKRSATAVFRFSNGQWQTDGRAIFNLNPHEAILHFGHELEAVV